MFQGVPTTFLEADFGWRNGMVRIDRLSRRRFSFGVASVLAAPSLLRAQTVPDAEDEERVQRNISSFVLHDWRDHFDTLGKGILLSDTTRRVLQHWAADGEMRLYPTSVPLTDELTRRGYTEVVEKRKNPGWAPTPAPGAT